MAGKALIDHVLFKEGTVINSSTNSPSVQTLFLTHFAADVKFTASGVSGASLLLQVSNNDSSDDTDWTTKSTQAFTGNDCFFFDVAEWAGQYIRIRFVLGAGSVTIIKAIAHGKQ